MPSVGVRKPQWQMTKDFSAFSAHAFRHISVNSVFILGQLPKAEVHTATDT